MLCFIEVYTISKLSKQANNKNWIWRKYFYQFVLFKTFKTFLDKNFWKTGRL